MFKKVELWILFLVIIISILIVIIFGVLVRQEIEGVTKKGRIDISILSKPAAYIARLPEQIAYKIFYPNPFKINYSFNEKRNFYNQEGFKGTVNNNESYLLLSRYDYELGESIVELIDLTNFKVLHTWNPDIDSFNKLVEKKAEFKHLERDKKNSRSRLIHPKLTEDGGLLFNDNTPLRKIDACSNLIFQNKYDSFHHSIETDNDGNIWAPTEKFPQSLPINKIGRNISSIINIKDAYIDDTIVKLSSDGKILFEKPVSEIFIENGLEYLLFSVGHQVFNRDPIHLNDIQPVLFDSKHWKKGDVFLSLRHQSMVLLYRPSSNKIIWKGVGPFFHQHDIDILDKSRISIFNNNSKNYISGDTVDGHNQVIIYDFENNEYYNYLSNSLVKEDVRTITEGLSEILPNGDLFVEESNFARTLYFNADGSLRWSHVNRAKNGDVYLVSWSRILYNKDDIKNVHSFLKLKGECDK